MKLALCPLSRNVVRAKPASPSGAGSATGVPSTRVTGRSWPTTDIYDRLLGRRRLHRCAVGDAVMDSANLSTIVRANQQECDATGSDVELEPSVAARIL